MKKGLNKGDRVVHAQYGTGTLTDVDNLHVVIAFDQHGTRRFVTDLVTIEATDIPAPERPAKSVKKGGTRTRAGS